MNRVGLTEAWAAPACDPAPRLGGDDWRWPTVCSLKWGPGRGWGPCGGRTASFPRGFGVTTGGRTGARALRTARGSLRSVPSPSRWTEVGNLISLNSKTKGSASQFQERFRRTFFPLLPRLCPTRQEGRPQQGCGERAVNGVEAPWAVGAPQLGELRSGCAALHRAPGAGPGPALAAQQPPTQGPEQP